MRDHANKNTKNPVIGGVKLATIVNRNVLATNCEFDPYLGFGRFTLGFAHLVDESGFVTSPAPTFRKARAHRTRRSPNLIGERIPFLFGKPFREFKYGHGRFKCKFVYLQTAVTRHPFSHSP